MGTGGSGQADAANLAKVDHVVVVMLENRSFDHMLGYLSSPAGAQRSTACARASPTSAKGAPTRCTTSPRRPWDSTRTILATRQLPTSSRRNGYGASRMATGPST
jgi:phospholipase C